MELCKFRVVGNRNDNPFFSNNLIIRGLNSGAKEMGLYDENGKTVVYSTVCDDYGYNADAFICLYETSLPIPIVQMAKGRPIFGSGLHNKFFITDSYPSHLVGYCPLGVDLDTFKPLSRSKNSRFRFLCFFESNARSGLDKVIHAFGQEFNDNKDVELYIKDRGATDTFKNWVKNISKIYNVDIIHDTENTQDFEKIRQIYANSDVCIMANRSTTWGMPNLEAFAMGIPLISINYSGIPEYFRKDFNGLEVEHDLIKITQEKLNFLSEIGCRNHLFPLNQHISTPYWAEPRLKSLKSQMRKFLEMDNEQKNYMSKGSLVTAQEFPWTKAAHRMSFELANLETKAKTAFQIENFKRYEY